MTEDTTEKIDTTEPSFKLNYVTVILLLVILIPALYTIVTNLQPATQVQITKSQAAQPTAAPPANNLENALKRVVDKPDYDAYINLGLAYYSAAKYDDAIKAWNKAIELNPKSALAYNDVAAAYGAISNWDEEIRVCEKALSLDPNMTLAKNNLNWAKAQKNKK